MSTTFQLDTSTSRANPTPQPMRRLTVPKIRARKVSGTTAEPLVMLTAYTARQAQLLDAHCDLLLVGDSLGQVIYGLPSTVPVTLEMTAPVTQSVAPGGFRVQFVLPKGVTLATAPEPLDPRVHLRDVTPSRVAVIRYSGFWSQSNYDKHLARLQAVLRDSGIAWTGDPVYSRYDAPFTPWFLRRNEIWLHLQTSG